MPVPAAITDLSTTPSSNSPPGGESIGGNMDDYIRTCFAFIAQLRTGAATYTAKNITGLITSSANEAMRINENQGFISGYNTAGSTRTGYLQFTTASSINLFAENGSAVTLGTAGVGRWQVDTAGQFKPFAHNQYTLGTPTVRPSALYSTLGDFSGALTGTQATFSGLVTAASVTVTSTLTLPNGVVTSGTYTPGLTGVSNVSAVTPKQCQWSRNGNVITVSGGFDLTPAAASNTNTQLGIALPVASDFSLSEHCGGTGAALDTGGGISMPARIFGDGTNNRATYQFLAGSTTPVYHSFTFTYLVI